MRPRLNKEKLEILNDFYDKFQKPSAIQKTELAKNNRNSLTLCTNMVPKQTCQIKKRQQHT